MTDYNKESFFSKGKIAVIFMEIISIGASLYKQIPENIGMFMFYGGIVGMLITILLYVKDYYKLPEKSLSSLSSFINNKLNEAQLLKEDSGLTIDKIKEWRNAVYNGIKSATGEEVLKLEEMTHKIAKRYGKTDRNSLLIALDADISILKKMIKTA